MYKMMLTRFPQTLRFRIVIHSSFSTRNLKKLVVSG